MDYSKGSNQFKNLIASHFTRRELKAGDFLYESGDYSPFIYFLEKGLLRMFYYNEEGKEITAWLTVEQNFVSAIGGPYSNQPAKEYCQVVEDVVIYEIKFDAFEKLLEQPLGAKMTFYALSELNQTLSRYLHFFKFHSAEERYRALMDFAPDIINRVSLGQIASFLGISQETLSRIRGRI
ncbi:Crp/Fnr family transcriptional regulator [Crocinitomix algicola]|uniref:Crp/Fnr family transcriptional regulator n=1 Tax=Crocinitomix algicola TaxID=1740263 RepID=UPI0009F6F032|nr:Crp/Fnr family transcriptional regulator [Crocinitomix algicola]